VLTSESTRRRFVAGALAGVASLRASCSSSRGLARQAARDAIIAISDVTVIDATGTPPSLHMTLDAPLLLDG
jgi:hypothetical protein